MEWSFGMMSVRPALTFSLWRTIASPNARASSRSYSSGCPSEYQGLPCPGTLAWPYQSFQPRTVSPLSSIGWTLMTNGITIADGFGQYSASIIRAINHNQLRHNFADCIESLYDDYRSQSTRTEMEDIVEYIDENLCEQWLSVQSVSDKFGISPSLLSTQFKLRTGQRPIDYIHTKRMELAIDYLHETDMSIRDISIKVGYGSIATMNRSFRNYAGVTPSWIRQHAKSGREKEQEQ